MGWRDRRSCHRVHGHPLVQIVVRPPAGLEQVLWPRCPARQVPRRLLDLSVSLTQGAEAMGMREGAAEVMRANLEPHRRVYRRFYEITQIRLQAVDQLFGSPE